MMKKFWISCLKRFLIISIPTIVGVMTLFTFFSKGIESALQKLGIMGGILVFFACFILTVILEINKTIKETENLCKDIDDVTLSTDEPLYIDEQIKYFKQAHKRIYVLMDSLNPEAKESKLLEFDTALENAHKSQSIVDVKLFTPNTDEKGRSRGAYDISERNLEIYFLDILSNKDLRFSIIDDDTVIISCKHEESEDFSKEFATIKSETLNRLLRGYLKDLVKNENPINFEQYLIKRLKLLGVLSKKISIKKASERLDIPEDYLLKFVNKYHNGEVCEENPIINIDIL